jgi:hypothetical protein
LRGRRAIAGSTEGSTTNALATFKLYEKGASWVRGFGAAGFGAASSNPVVMQLHARRNKP